MKTKYMIAFTVPVSGMPDLTVYLPDKPTWDGAWYTRDDRLAKVYARKGNASRVLNSLTSEQKAANARLVPVIQ